MSAATPTDDPSTAGPDRRTFSYDPLTYAATVPAMLAAVVAAHGDNDLLVSALHAGGLDRVTYREADERSAEMAARLIAVGVGAGTRVGILAPNGPDFVVAFLAITRIGGVAVPINTFFQAPELRWLIRDAGLHTVLAVEELLGKDSLARLTEAIGWPGVTDGPLRLPDVPALRAVLPLGDHTREWPTTWPEAVAPGFRRAVEETVRPADDVAIIYTSGSTSDPKGIIHTHASVIEHSRFIASRHEWTSDDRVYVPMVFFWIGGLVFGLTGPMQIGVTILTEERFDPGDVLALLAGEKATYATGFPHVGPALVNHPDYASTDLSALREGYQQVLLSADRRTADPSLRVAQLGMTETCSSHTWWPPHEQLPEHKRGSLGVSAPGYEHKIVDADGVEVPDGVTGEICVRGRALMRGIVGRTRDETFDADGWYHTKDGAYRDADGHLYFAGRVDDMVKTSGANVAPVEVEEVLMRIEGVRIAYVVGVPDPEKGAVVAGVVVRNDGARIGEDELRTACRAQLSAYKVPKLWVVLDDVDRLPYTTTSKIDKRRLVALLGSGELRGDHVTSA
ncbi:class I adenylate-forming enzyme family protein [uncultured Williamsia sp.]|uniref:class I adenylate-forming enzyme family protein n=1 Tax=uncultured Williamsia sp. TaxID=259311 RepID=UPI002604A13E|nr:class I adenylate-forming enzyme family protein [uncultured Williamsia sp.]